MRRILVRVAGLGVCLMIALAVLPLLSTKDDSQPVARPAQGVNPMFARWAADYAKHDTYTKTPIHLGFSRALSKRFTKAVGRVEINFETGQVTVAVENLDAPPAGSVHEVWLVENIPGPHNNAAIDLGDDGDRIIKLGELPHNGSLVKMVNTKKLDGFEVDMVAVMRRSPNQEPEYVIGGMQSIMYQMNRQARLAGDHSSTLTGAFDFWSSPVLADKAGPHPHGGGNGNGNGDLIAQGEDLFFGVPGDPTVGTFGGNGRTCGTCHPAENNFTIDVDFIAGLPANDPLFLAELTAEAQALLDELNPPINLPPLVRDPTPPFTPSPSVPAFEDPMLMTMRGLILENVRGFEVDVDGFLVNPPVFRAVPALFNLEFTAPYGYGACCPNLQDFAMGAVIQHLTRTLDRVPASLMDPVDFDFRFPTDLELAAMEAFMMSLLLPADGNFKVKGKNSFLSTPEDTRANDTTRAEVRGRDLFLSVGCTSCHSAKGKNAVFDGGNRDTGVESIEIPHMLPNTPTTDGGVVVFDDDGNLVFTGRFQTPQLFGMRKQHFFHTGSIGNNLEGDEIPNETLQFTNLRDAVAFYVSTEFKDSPTGGQVGAMTEEEIRDIAAFLEFISVP